MGATESHRLVGEKLGLTRDEIAGIVYYISPDGYKINDKLRNNFPLDADEVATIKNLDSALDKLPDYVGVVYRVLYVEDVDDFVCGYEVNEVQWFLAYTSSSTIVLDDEAPIKYIINSKTGKDVRPFNKDESEIIFRRNTWFRVDMVDGYTIYMTEM